MGLLSRFFSSTKTNRRLMHALVLLLLGAIIVPDLIAQTIPTPPTPAGVTVVQGDGLTTGKNFIVWILKWALYLIVGIAWVLGIYGIVMPMMEVYKGRKEMAEVGGALMFNMAVVLVSSMLGAYAINTYFA
jgi:hypothetical protein